MKIRMIVAAMLVCSVTFITNAQAQTAKACGTGDRDCPIIEKAPVRADEDKMKASIRDLKLELNSVPDRAGYARKADPFYSTKMKTVAGVDDSNLEDKAEAQTQAAQDPDTLRKAAQNPVASLISVPLQNNTSFGVGPNGDRIQNVFIAQPVVPVSLTSSVNLIMRFVTPIIYQPNTFSPTPAVPSGQFGLGDINPSFFFSPKKVGKVIWGVGPTFIIPTATGRTLGQGKLQIGPTVVALVQPNRWTLGVLVNNTWSVAGKSDRPSTNQGILQYFINYNLNKGYYLTWQPTITFNWKATGANRWLVPFGGGVGRIMKIGNQPVNVTVQAYANPIRQPNAAPFMLRFQIAFLYPKKR